MLRYTPENAAKALKQRYSPEGFLGQYSEAEGLDVLLGAGVIEERGGDFFAVTYPLLIGGQESGGHYTIDARGIYCLDNPDIVAVSFSGKHPLAKDAILVQLTAKMAGRRFVRGNDVWLDIVFPGIELPSQEKRFSVQPQRRVAVATALALSGSVLEDIETLLRNF